MFSQFRPEENRAPAGPAAPAPAARFIPQTFLRGIPGLKRAEYAAPLLVTPPCAGWFAGVGVAQDVTWLMTAS